MKAGIIGLGLMGGSLGLALRESGQFSSIIGEDNNPIHRRQAVYLGLVDECLDAKSVLDCDVVFLCAPVDAIVGIVAGLDSLRENQLIIDFGSVKQKIIAAIPSHLRGHFVSLHPMCGTEDFGPKAARADLYKNQVVIFVDIADSADFQANLAREICINLGMKIIKMPARAHDHHTALISHMPHILSYALANAVLKHENAQDIVAIAGGGFRSMSRLSKSSGTMWSEISKQNKPEILDSLEAFLAELNDAIELIRRDDYEALAAWMANANTLREIL